MNIKNTLTAIALITFSSASIAYAYDDLIGFSDRNQNIANELSELNYQLKVDKIDRQYMEYMKVMGYSDEYIDKMNDLLMRIDNKYNLLDDFNMTHEQHMKHFEEIGELIHSSFLLELEAQEDVELRKIQQRRKEMRQHYQ